MIAWNTLRELSRTFKRELRLYRALLKDRRTPRIARCLLGAAVGYALLPFDVTPDFLPVVGHLDDVIILPALIFLTLKLIPADLVKEARAHSAHSETAPAQNASTAVSHRSANSSSGDA